MIRELGRMPAVISSNLMGSGRRAKTWRAEILPGDRSLYLGRLTDWSCPVARARRVKKSVKRTATRLARRVSTAELQLQLAELGGPDQFAEPELPHLTACVSGTTWCPTLALPLPQFYRTGIPLDWVKNRRRQPVPEQAAS